MADAQHWARWHDRYDDPRSSLARRLVAVKQQLSETLDRCPVGPISLISMCAGQGRDVTEVLAVHPRASDVSALLVDSDHHMVDDARRRALAAASAAIEVRQADASLTSAYHDAVPADVILVCGVFGNISDADIHRTIGILRCLSASNAHVIWTRHRREPDLTPMIREWFNQAGFEQIAFEADDHVAFGVGTHRLVAPSTPYRNNQRMFAFTGDGGAAHS